MPQNVEAVKGVRAHLRHGTYDRLSLRPPDFERLVQTLVDDELKRPCEPQRRDRPSVFSSVKAARRSSASRRASCSVSRYGREPPRTVTLAILCQPYASRDPVTMRFPDRRKSHLVRDAAAV
jgi:hypothetical protein